jgi:hypothetical protein
MHNIISGVLCKLRLDEMSIMHYSVIINDGLMMLTGKKVFSYTL